MNIFMEFYRLAQRLQKSNASYALIGGVAMAFHTRPRFTKDIDLLIRREEITAVTRLLREEGYLISAPPWKFKNTGLTLHRFLKVEDGDEMIVDVLVSPGAAYDIIIDRAEIAESETLGRVRVVRKQDLIRLKKARNSKMDQADIESLEKCKKSKKFSGN